MAEREKMLQAGIERWLRESKLVPCNQKCPVWEMEVASATLQHIFMFEDKVLLTQAKYPNILINFSKFSFIFPLQPQDVRSIN